ncbi:MAG: rhodanese-related sulfurtransferase [Bacteroidetes bacterium]|nr:rhodanese-related sulfurtransferase [Bacteroidota bacterium]
MQLSNRIDKRILKERMAQSTEKRITISFYKYHQLENPTEFRNQFYIDLEKMGALGRIYIAKEGINAQMSIAEEHLEDFKTYINSIPFLMGIRLNFAVEDKSKAFFKLKIIVKDKIVADGIDDPTFDSSNCGIHLKAKDFNEITQREDIILVDMRNHYESEVGHFKHAILPDVDTFREQLPYVAEQLKDKKDHPIVMYCTGGIRCEKASAYMKHHGFDNVYQLEGGIIKYARDAKEQGLENQFIGKNFVFDERLGERITEDIIAHCHQCGEPADTHINCANEGCHLLFIQCEKCAAAFDKCCSQECKDIIHLPLEEQISLRKGIDKGRQVFKKGRSAKLLFGKHI